MTQGETLEEVFEAIEDARHDTLGYAVKRDTASLNQYISRLLALRVQRGVIKENLRVCPLFY